MHTRVSVAQRSADTAPAATPDAAMPDVGQRFAHRLPFGAHCLGDGRTQFRLWAPSQSQVWAELADRERVQMHAHSDGVHEVTLDCAPGTPYRYRLADGLAVPDPAARAQATDVHGDSVVVDPLAYRWRHPQWRGRPWHETVIYELHVGACGGYDGVARMLPRLAELGITAIELMPLAQFPGTRNWGYDGVLPYAPQSSYGAPTRLKALVDAAHGHGLMVFLDVVYNHFGPDGCYLHRYAPQFFRTDQITPWGPAIDFRQPQVRDYFTHNVLYWLQEYRFDGLRFDAVHAIEPCGWLDEVAREVRTTVGCEREVHLILENDANVAACLRRDAASGFDAQWNDDIHHALHVLLTQEREGYYRNFAEAPERLLARCLGEGFAYQGEHSPSHGHPRGTVSAGLPPHAFVSFLQNHDQIGNRALGERLCTLAHADALHAALAVLLLSPQIPLLFMGEEWGCTQPFLYFTDHHGELAAAVRDGRRREFAHFESFAGAPERIPDPNDPATFQASIPDTNASNSADGRVWTARYRSLLQQRHAVVVPRLQDRRSEGAAAAVGRQAQIMGPAAVCARWQLGDCSVLTIAANLGVNAVAFAAPDAVLLYDSGGERASAAVGRLPGYCTRAFLAPAA